VRLGNQQGSGNPSILEKSLFLDGVSGEVNRTRVERREASDGFVHPWESVNSQTLFLIMHRVCYNNGSLGLAHFLTRSINSGVC
jgi:hypothetical protein